MSLTGDLLVLAVLLLLLSFFLSLFLRVYIEFHQRSYELICSISQQAAARAQCTVRRCKSPVLHYLVAVNARIVSRTNRRRHSKYLDIPRYFQLRPVPGLFIATSRTASDGTIHQFNIRSNFQWWSVLLFICLTFYFGYEQNGRINAL